MLKTLFLLVVSSFLSTSYAQSAMWSASAANGFMEAFFGHNDNSQTNDHILYNEQNAYETGDQIDLSELDLNDAGLVILVIDRENNSYSLTVYDKHVALKARTGLSIDNKKEYIIEPRQNNGFLDNIIIKDTGIHLNYKTTVVASHYTTGYYPAINTELTSIYVSN